MSIHSIVHPRKAVIVRLLLHLTSQFSNTRLLLICDPYIQNVVTAQSITTGLHFRVERAQNGPHRQVSGPGALLG